MIDNQELLNDNTTINNPVETQYVDEYGNPIDPSMIDENGNYIGPKVDEPTVQDLQEASTSAKAMNDKELLTGMVTFDYNNVPITDIVNSIILDAINKGASDIHLIHSLKELK